MFVALVSACAPPVTGRQPPTTPGVRPTAESVVDPAPQVAAAPFAPEPTLARLGGSECNVEEQRLGSAGWDADDVTLGFDRHGGLAVWQGVDGSFVIQPIDDRGRPRGDASQIRFAVPHGGRHVVGVADGFVILAAAGTYGHMQWEATVTDAMGRPRQPAVLLDLDFQYVMDVQRAGTDALVVLAMLDLVVEGAPVWRGAGWLDLRVTDGGKIEQKAAPLALSSPLLRGDDRLSRVTVDGRPGWFIARSYGPAELVHDARVAPLAANDRPANVVFPARTISCFTTSRGGNVTLQRMIDGKHHGEAIAMKRAAPMALPVWTGSRWALSGSVKTTGEARVITIECPLTGKGER